MEGELFDRWTKGFVRADSRRGVLRGLAAGTIAGFVSRVGITGAVAGDVSTADFDLTCRQTGTTFYCVDPTPNTECGPSRLSCFCAQTRNDSKPKCVAQPHGGCPKRHDKCRRNKDCNGNDICIRVSDCCPNHTSWGKCVTPCGE
jgi:hypothetical protein